MEFVGPRHYENKQLNASQFQKVFLFPRIWMASHHRRRGKSWYSWTFQLEDIQAMPAAESAGGCLRSRGSFNAGHPRVLWERKRQKVLLQNGQEDKEMGVGMLMKIFCRNGRESAVNKLLDGSTYPG
jgi:hypothetical protein